MTDKEIKCPCGYRKYMKEHNCQKTDCDKCCPLSLQETINRQQAEIETLKEAVEIHKGIAEDWKYEAKKLKEMVGETDV